MRLFHRVEDPLIPAENNFAERELRPLVIARKISFGSQSDAGARTREIMMTILHTLEKRSPNVEAAFKAALNKNRGRSGNRPLQGFVLPELVLNRISRQTGRDLNGYAIADIYIVLKKAGDDVQ